MRGVPEDLSAKLEGVKREIEADTGQLEDNTASELRRRTEAELRAALQSGNLDESQEKLDDLAQALVEAQRNSAWFYTHLLREVKEADEAARQTDAYEAHYSNVETTLRINTSAENWLEELYHEVQTALSPLDSDFINYLAHFADEQNNIVTTEQFSPETISDYVQRINKSRVPVQYALLPIANVNTIGTNADFESWFDPISKWEIVITGGVGILLGFALITDGYRTPDLQVLNGRQFYIGGIDKGEYVRKATAKVVPYGDSGDYGLQITASLGIYYRKQRLPTVVCVETSATKD